MWKYIDKQMCNEFLLSLCLIDGKSDKDKIKKLYSISNNIKGNYDTYIIPKKSGGYRLIYSPKYTLKKIQKNILKNILENKKISEYARAYHKGINLVDNVSPHLNKKLILKLDIHKFFQNISFYDVYNSCFPIEYFPKSIGMLLTRLCTYDGHLIEGAPTSSYISNLVMKEFDEEIGFYCKNNQIDYTRYSDDMTFSGDFNPSDIIRMVKKNLRKLGLELNKDKIRVLYRHQRQIITGLVVNDKINVQRTYKKKIRQEIYYIKKYGLDNHLERIGYSGNKIEYLNVILGKINFILNVNYDKEFVEYKKIINTYRKNEAKNT